MPKTVLLIDDEDIVVEIAKRKIQQSGYEVMTATDGEDALKQLESRIPDLIVLDVQMPKMDGYSFLVERNKRSQAAAVPVIAVTAHAQIEPMFKRYGVRAYLLKPLKLQELLDKIAEVLGPAA